MSHWKRFELMHDCCDSLRLSEYTLFYGGFLLLCKAWLIFLIKHFNVTQHVCVSWYSLVKTQVGVFKKSSDFFNHQHQCFSTRLCTALTLCCKTCGKNSWQEHQSFVQQCVLWRVCSNIFHWDKGVSKKNDTIVNFPYFVTLYGQIYRLLKCFTALIKGQRIK